MSSKFLNKIKYLILPTALVSIFFLFVIPSPVDAILVGEALAPFTAMLDGIEEKAGPISLVLIIIFFVYAKALVLLWVATKILDRVIWLNREMVEVGGPMVEYGWEFVSGLANMFLILIFIACAFAIILKIESFQAKKILPKLIIVALLLNFSLVFIGMLIDVANIVYATFLPPIGENLMGKLMDPFLTSGLASVIAQAAAIIATAKLYMAPPIAPFIQLALVTGITTVALPFIITLISQIIIFTILSGMFFLYVFIFGARIFIIQILAVLSPLAFLCLILPRTKQYWDMWLKWLLGWLFVGIFLLFFLRLGFLIFERFRTGLDLGIPWFHNLGDYFMFYLFVFIYLGITAFIAKKTMPEFAQAAIETAKGIVKTAAVVGGGKLLLRSLRKQTAETEVAQEVAIDEAEKKKSRGEKLTWGDKLTLSRWGGRGITKVAKWAYRQAGTTAQREEEKYAREDAKRYSNLAVSAPGELNAKIIIDPEKRAARAIALIDAGNAHKVNNEDAKELLKIGNPNLIKAIAPNYLKQMGASESFETQRENTKNDEERVKINIAERITNKLTEEKKGETKEEREERRVTAVQKVFPTKGEKIENIKPTEELARTMIEFDIPTHQIANFARIHGSGFANVFTEALKKMQTKKDETGKIRGAEGTAEYLMEERPELVKYIRTCPTTELEFPKEIRRELERMTAKKKTQKRTKTYDAQGNLVKETVTSAEGAPEETPEKK